MSGNFDFPPATTRQGQAPSFHDASNIVRETASHRNALRHRIEEVRRLRDHMNNSDERQRLRVVREELRRRTTAEPRPANGNTASDAQAPTSAMRSRLENVRYRARQRVQDRTTPSGSGGTVQQAVERLNEASSNLSSLLDQPIPRIESPDMSAREYSGEAEVNRRRAKRRKLDADPSSAGHLRGFSYGYRGQVVPGPLKMEIVSCDGGLHTEAARHGREYWPENVLRNDKSVYCTDNNKCNLILRHMGETTFCLKKLVIKAPERGFTAPIQEGMVFVSMLASDLLTRTAQYQMRDPSPLQESEDLEPLFSDDANESRPPSRRRDSSAQRTVPPPISNLAARSNRYYHTRGFRTSGQPFPAIDLRHDSTPPSQTFLPPEPADFAVTTSCNDPSSDEEEPSSAATLADRLRRDHLPSPFELSSEEDTEDGLERGMRRARVLGVSSSHTYYRRNSRRAEPSKIEIVGAADVSGDGTENEKVLAPHARFFIERTRSVVSVKFDPPVSGKFILLKLWSPSKEQNIDIQSIVAYGFAGPRFFPAAQMT
ncbi:hypothetical protein HO173_000330 [Letharia columbiana]|uniref:Uncharacterized protein n=1 Tax=Letharia columbiana TaxID=112416 RepID=A0A8H6LAK9_9LECA|nr:uncharacterized protein HO173_000330 [Letharia columbiana]KAF6241619.1 hypothetical protein HO173_000330 [Letharia columbiana]